MRNVRGIQFIYYTDMEVYETPEAFNMTPEMQEKQSEIFGYLEGLLEELGISTDNATIDHFPCEWDILLDSDEEEEFWITSEDRMELLKKLEEIFDVTYYEVFTEYDEWDGSWPTVTYGFSDKTE